MWPQFGYGLGGVVERFERFRFSVPAVPLMGCVADSVYFNRFGSWKRFWWFQLRFRPPGLPSSRDPLHPFIFVFELITVTFTSPLHLINSWELFFGRCNRGRGARYWAVCVLLADSSCVMFRIWTSFGSFVLVWRSADLKLQALPP